MATSRTKGVKAPVDGFDVTCVIGRVVFDNLADESAHVAAFKVIAQSDTQGSFTFPMGNGDTCRVDVAYESDSRDELDREDSPERF